jgi:manganese efflux pump family protein
MLANFLLGISLAMDCFAIALSQGLRADSENKHLLRLALLFGFFQGGMLLVGWLGGSFVFRFLGNYTDWLAAALLAAIGLKMLKEGNTVETSELEPILGPWKDYFLLSIATSIDALAAGISLPALRLSIFEATLMVALTSTGLALVGAYAGRRLGEQWGAHAEKIGGLVLLGLAFKVLVF